MFGDVSLVAWKVPSALRVSAGNQVFDPEWAEPIPDQKQVVEAPTWGGLIL